MIEISVIRDNKVIYSKDFNNYIEKLKKKVPDAKKMKEMETKFLDLVKNDSTVGNIYKISSGVGISMLTNSTVAYAEPLQQVSEKIRTITNPVVEFFAGLGYPVTYGMLITGSIMIIMGKKSKGLEVIKWACIGYIGLQFVPFILILLDIIGKELRNAMLL